VSTVIAREVTKAVAPLMILASINFFLQGHNLPGGGFIAGVMTSAAFALVYIVFDFRDVSKLTGATGNAEVVLLKKYVPVSGAGLLLALGSGILSISLGLNFLEHIKGTLHLSFLGSIHWTTAMIFDLGVYLTVTGSLLTMVEVLGRE
jgi:multicomponent Na+:H+ antiporter subunit B